MADWIGHDLGNYRILRQLGQGSFATVYLGEHRYLHRLAALKLLHIALTETQITSFLEEARLLAGLQHTSIVQVFEFFVQEETPVLVMEYAPQGTLRQCYPPHSRLPLSSIVQHIQQIADALQYAHNHNIIHRDVKPENLLLSADRQLLLSDFGLALFTPSPEQLSTQGMAGTPTYMAPEQLRGKPTFASDQYALGVLTYEWLSGKRPFEGGYWDLLYQHAFQPPPSLHITYPDISEAVEAVILRALAKSPQDRFPSIQGYASALARVAQEQQHEIEADQQITSPLHLSPHTAFQPSPTSQSKTPHQIFISAAPADHTLEERLRYDLSNFASLLATPSKDDDEALRQLIRSASLMLLILSPHTQGSHAIKEHLRIASIYQKRVIFIWMDGDDLETLLVNGDHKTIPGDVIDARHEHYKKALQEIIASLEIRTPDAPLIASFLREPRNPYKGLRPFFHEDKQDFFGHEALTAQLLQSIKKMTQENMQKRSNQAFLVQEIRLLGIVGPSGSGKSSVVMAGLLPQLYQGTAIHESSSWLYPDPLVPGVHPITSLALTLGKLLPNVKHESIVEDLLDDSTRGLHRLAMQLCTQPLQKVIFVIDQFEELFTLTSSETERKQFLDLIVTATSEPFGPVIIVLTLRADFYDRPLAYLEFGAILHQNRHIVMPMEPHELRAVIEQPAALPDVQIILEGSLIGDLLYETQDQIGALPLLEFTLDQLFHLREGSWLTQKAYQQIGGVRGALAKHAEATYDALPSDEHRSLAKALFLRLIEPGLSEQDTTRRRAALSELLLPDAEDTLRLTTVTEIFTTARLLTTNKVGEVATIEVSHEALIREWKRLSTWLDEAREDIHFQQSLSDDVTQWEQRGKPHDRLYRGTLLREARAWGKRNKPSRQEIAFLKTSTTYQQRSTTSLIALLLLLVFISGIAIRLFLVPPVPSPTLVTTLQEDGAGSIRQAIAVAKSGDTITFASNLKGSILLKHDSLIITKKLTIQGPGANLLAIKGAINIFTGTSVTFSGLTFAENEDFAFFSNEGRLTLINCIVAHNKVIAIVNNGTLLLVNTLVAHNGTEPTEVGAIDNNSTATLQNSIVLDNAGFTGGGITNDGKLTLLNSSVLENKAQYGGGIYSQGDLTIVNSTIAKNKAYADTGPNGYSVGDGGGIYQSDGSLSITNSTIAENVATGVLTNQKNLGGGGGGIYLSSGKGILNFCTIYGNSAYKAGGMQNGDILTDPFTKLVNKQVGNVAIANTLIAGNHAQIAPDVSGEVSSHGYNLIQDLSDVTFLPPFNEHTTDLSGEQLTNLQIDPNLQPIPITSTKGITLLMYRLYKGSPLIDRIPLAICQRGALSTDERGVKRPQGKMCDIGAYEYVPGS